MSASVEQAHKPQAIIAAVAPHLLRTEIDQLPAAACLMTWGGFKVFAADAGQIPHMLREIARLREVSFRAVGEGTGQALDLDSHDANYQHLFVWNGDTSELIGAYRVGFTDALVADQGVAGLYTYSLFEFGPELFDRLGPCLELGRSFVRPEWQGNTRALRLLWAGIAAILERHTEIEHLFGPVSVSPQLSEFGRWLIMSALQLHHMDEGLMPLIHARHAPCLQGQAWHKSLTEVTAGLADPGRLSKFLQRIEQGIALPMLIKHYIALKGRFAGFNVDTSFNNTLDGLVFVKVKDIPHKMRTRLTGRH